MKSKPNKSNKKRRKEKKEKGLKDLPPIEQAQRLLEEATALVQTGQADQALPLAEKSLQCLSSDTTAEESLQLPVLEQLAEIYVELGDGENARETFVEAARIDPSGEIPDELGGGADKFLWLAQLCEEGGAESVNWFEKGIIALRRQIGELEENPDEEDEIELEEKRDKLANALCGAAEVYMTDLSWEDDAEARCETLVTEACLVAPQSPEPLQTLASVRISQTKFEDARAALLRSMALWTELLPEDPKVPEFPTRISLARLLMEVQLEEKALDVLERLVVEDDSSVEAWYLGGWCLYLMSQKPLETQGNEASRNEEQAKKLQRNSREWLLNSLRLFKLLDYEDDRLGEHATELVDELNKILGPPPSKDELEDMEDEDEEEWQDTHEEEEEEQQSLNGEKEMEDVR